jgi:ribA/ribD-fused uncharacterized protein
MTTWVDKTGVVHDDCIVFFRTREAWGGLSNMAPYMSLFVEVDHGHDKFETINIRTSEALYQACRFPDDLKKQKAIIDAHGPMSAKMKSKAGGRRDELTRSDWYEIREEMMYWCLRVKLACNIENFGGLLRQTVDRPIVERSSKDDFWGAMFDDDGVLRGDNILGKLLMRLRDEYCANIKDGQPAKSWAVPPLSIPNFRLLGGDILPLDTTLGMWQNGDTAWYVRTGSEDNRDHDCLFAVLVKIVRRINRATAMVKVLGWNNRVEKADVARLFWRDAALVEMKRLAAQFDIAALVKKPGFVYPDFTETSNNWISATPS